MLFKYLLTCILALFRILTPASCATAADDMPSIFIPLYIYPKPGAWDFLYDLASRHTELDFTVVVNPNSGPGQSSLPDENYQREIQKIYAHPNIRPLGYVATTYGVKDLAAVKSEIATYAKWGTQQPQMAMNGIFFDETPWQFDPQLSDYLAQVSSAVRNITGWATANSVVVHNPGCIPAAEYMRSADITVVMETNYTTYIQNNLANDLTNLTATANKDSLCVLLHSVPPDLTDTRTLVDQLRSVAHHLWVSDSSVDYYNVSEPYVNGRFEELVISEIEEGAMTNDRQASNYTETKQTSRLTAAVATSSPSITSSADSSKSGRRKRRRGGSTWGSWWSSWCCGF